jgi:hypothetical protein
MLTASRRPVGSCWPGSAARGPGGEGPERSSAPPVRVDARISAFRRVDDAMQARTVNGQNDEHRLSEDASGSGMGYGLD